MSRTADQAWSERNQRRTTQRTAYLAGFEDGAFEERLRLVEFISANMSTISSFAGSTERAGKLLTFVLTEMKPASVPTATVTSDG